MTEKTTTPDELGAAHGSVVIPCVIMCDVDVETNTGTGCPNPVTHWWHPDSLPKHKALVCTMHATRLSKVGQKVTPLHATPCNPPN